MGSSFSYCRDLTILIALLLFKRPRASNRSNETFALVIQYLISALISPTNTQFRLGLMSKHKSFIKKSSLGLFASLLVACGDGGSGDGVVTLSVKCENRKGWIVLIKHVDDEAVLIKPVENPIDGYNPVASGVDFKETDVGFWYDGKQLTRKWGVKSGEYFRGYESAKYDKRSSDFTISSLTRASRTEEWQARASGGIYDCRAATEQDFAMYEK